MRKTQPTKKPTLDLTTETLRRLDDKTLATVIGGATDQQQTYRCTAKCSAGC